MERAGSPRVPRMAENSNSPQQLPGRTAKRKWTDEERLNAIRPLLNMARTEELLAAHAAEVGTSSRSLHRWIADYEGTPPGSTKLRFDFPAAALFIAARHFAGDSIRTIHQALQSQWETL